MHFAAERCQEEAIGLLNQKGAHSDMTDYEDRTLAQVLKAMKLRDANTTQ